MPAQGSHIRYWAVCHFLLFHVGLIEIAAAPEHYSSSPNGSATLAKSSAPPVEKQGELGQATAAAYTPLGAHNVQHCVSRSLVATEDTQNVLHHFQE